MPHSTEQLDLEAEHDRLVAEYETARDDLEADPDDAGARQRADRARRHAAAVEWLVDEYGADADLVVGGLTMGEDAQVLDRVEQARATQTHDVELRGIARNWTVAAGVETAPFYDDDAADLSDRIESVADLPRHVGKYLYAQISAAETLEPDLGNGSDGG